MLTVRGLWSSYGGIVALRNVDIEVSRGEIVALIGRNGAGKSTMLNCLSGVVKAASGSITFDGQDLTGRRPAYVARQGLLQVPEGRQIFARLTVEDNLELGRLARRQRASRYELRNVFDLFPVLEERRLQIAGLLSGGQQQMLAIGRALMGEPRLLLLDEPSLGLGPLVIAQVFECLRRLNDDGLTILLVEQNARQALQVTDRAYVIDQGEIVEAGRSADMIENPRIQTHYLGVIAESRGADAS